MRTQRVRKEERDDSTEMKRVHTNNVKHPAKADRWLQLVGGKELSLDQLLRACLQAGQEELWTEFVRRSQPLIAQVVIRTLSCRIKPDPDLVDDLVQETYLKLCFNDFTILRRFVPRHDHALEGFLKVVASNTVRDHYRKRGGGMAEVSLDCIPELPVSRRPFETLERQILLREIEKNLVEADSDSPTVARDLKIFLLYYRHGFTAEAISRLRSIGLSSKGVESAILRIVHLIKLTMRKHQTQ